MSNLDDERSTVDTKCCECECEHEEGLVCDECKYWWCRSCISGGIPNVITDKLYEQLSGFSEFPWSCSRCSEVFILQQFVSNKTFSKQNLEDFGCNRMVLRMVTDEPSQSMSAANDGGTVGATASSASRNVDSTFLEMMQKMQEMQVQMQQSMVNFVSTVTANQQQQMHAMVSSMQPPQQSNQSLPVPNVAISTRVPIKLPKVELPVFCGDVLQWPNFWESFSINVHDQNIPDQQKMDYLLRSLKGTALNKVKGLRLNGSSYAEAIKILKTHYSNPVLQRRSLWERLHSLCSVRDNLSNLEYFVDEFRATVIAMRQQGIDDAALTGYVPEILKKLPQAVVTEMSRMRMLHGHAMDEIDIADIMNFLEQQLQLLTISTSRQSKPFDIERKFEKRPAQQQVRTMPTMIAQQSQVGGTPQHQTASGRSCVFCKATGHYSDDCNKVTSVAARKSSLSKEKRCFNCLGNGHRFNECKRRKPCFHCKSRDHHSALCTARNNDGNVNQMVSDVNESTTTEDRSGSNEVQVHLNQVGQNDGIVMAAFPCKVVNMDNNQIAELLVYADGGCRRTCISSQAAEKLGLQSKRDVTLQVARFNSNVSDNVNAKVVEVGLCGIDGKRHRISGFCVPKTSPPLKVGPIELSKASVKRLRDLKPINQPPKRFKQYNTIDVLLGQDYFNSFFGPHVKATKVQHQLYVYHTQLGNVLCGSSKPCDVITDAATQMLQNMVCAVYEDPVEQLWKLESIGIVDDPKSVNNKHEEVMQRFIDNVKTTESGRYEVGFPWKRQPVSLSSNYRLAKQRLRTTMASLRSKGDETLRSYDDIIREQLRNGIVEEIQPERRDGPLVHYVAHFPVVKVDKATTKVRIVYDASVPTKSEKKSLNDQIYAGPCMLNDLTGVLLRFRMYVMPLVADIEKAFLQVALKLEDRDATRFLWVKDIHKHVDDPTNLQFFRFARLPFGIIASPHLLGATVKFHVQRYNSDVKDQILRDLYVDNTIIDAKTLEEAKHRYVEAKTMFADAGMNLREWASANAEFNASLPDQERNQSKHVKVLGVEWSTVNDTIRVLYGGRDHEQMTKRRLRSAISSVFDPLGLFVPVTIMPRLAMQEVWKTGLDWNDTLPEDIRKRWIEQELQLRQIPTVELNRRVSQNNAFSSQLIAFTDASQVAYGTCVYLRQSTETGDVSVNLVFGKARVAPLKPLMTIPKLELTAVLIGCRALRFVKKQLHVEVSQMMVFTDSQIVLNWLKTERALTPYVERRVHEILDEKDIQFYYVSTKENPADMASRGTTVTQLTQSTWFSGPEWLIRAQEEWPKWLPVDKPMPEESACESLLVHTQQASKNPVGISSVQVPKRSLLFTLRVTCYVLRFLNRSRRSAQGCHDFTTAVVTTDELCHAKDVWIKSLQQTAFREELTLVVAQKSNQLIKQLDLCVKNGILCCGGRLNKGLGDDCFPRLLPKDHAFTKMVIFDAHEHVFHSGVKSTLTYLRRKFWIPHGHAQVKKILRGCVVCRRIQGAAFNPPRMAELPLERVQRAPAFKYTGIDYLGPLYIKEHGQQVKKWVAVFTCFTSRAIHLEVVDDCTTEALTQAMLRFIGRRGTPAVILSDNATQFQKGSSVFKAIWGAQVPSYAIDEMVSFCSKKGMRWKFIPEGSPWVGGFYERLVGLVKRALKKVLWRTTIDSAMLQTLLVQIEGVLNTRPLIAPSSDPSDPPLCPAQFVAPCTQLVVPPGDEDFADPAYVPDPKAHRSLMRLWEQVDRKLDQFWKTWQTQYLKNCGKLIKFITAKNTERSTDYHASERSALSRKQHQDLRGRWALS